MCSHTHKSTEQHSKSDWLAVVKVFSSLQTPRVLASANLPPCSAPPMSTELNMTQLTSKFVALGAARASATSASYDCTPYVSATRTFLPSRLDLPMHRNHPPTSLQRRLRCSTIHCLTRTSRGCGRVSHTKRLSSSKVGLPPSLLPRPPCHSHMAYRSCYTRRQGHQVNQERNECCFASVSTVF